MVGHLIMSLHVTRDAAANFQDKVRSFMNKNKADQSKYSASVYHNKECGLINLVDGDDFITVGNRKNIRWFNNKLQGRFEIKTKIIGQGEEDREVRILNWIIRVTPGGLGVRARPETRGYLHPGHEPLRSQGNQGAGQGREELEDERERPGRGPQGGETHFRALAARANYSALDRMDLQYATKEVCMAASTRGHVKKLRRLIRYLIEAPRVVTEYNFQVDVREMEVFSDSNWTADGQRDPPAVES